MTVDVAAVALVRATAGEPGAGDGAEFLDPQNGDQKWIPSPISSGSSQSGSVVNLN